MSDLVKLFEEVFGPTYDTAASTTAHQKIQVELALAGVKKEEIEITTDEGFLRVNVNSAKRKGTRSIPISSYHDIEKIDVKYENGLLTIEVPLKKAEEKIKRKIEIR